MKSIFSLFAAILLCSCSPSAVLTPTDLAAKSFPLVSGNSLNKQPVTIPDDFLGRPTVVLVGYLQKAQFDIDRWILGLLQLETQAQIVEVPTIAGMMPQMVQSFIDGGMRSGIPKEDWASVVTVYEDADKIIQAIGNERPNNAHVILLDREGRIVWSANRGYSASQVLELDRAVQALLTANTQ